MLGTGTVTPVVLAGAFSEFLDAFGIHWQLLLIQALNFLCVVTVLYYFALRPILKTMEARREKIESGLAYAEEMKEKLAEVDERAAKRLVLAKEEARKIVEEAKVQAKSYTDKQQREMEQMTQEMLASAKQSIADEKAQMLHDLKGEVKVLVTEVAAKVLSRELSPEERERYTEVAEIEL